MADPPTSVDQLGIPPVGIRAGDKAYREVHSQGRLVPLNVFDVRDYGAVGDENHDDSAAFQKAVDAASRVPGRGKVVYIPYGIYIVGGVKIPAEGDYIHFLGAGCTPTLRAKDAASNIFWVDTAIGVTFQNLDFGYEVTRTGGWAIKGNGGRINVFDCTLSGQYGAIKLEDANNSRIRGVRTFNTINQDLLIVNGKSIHVSQIVFTSAGGSRTGIKIETKAGAATEGITITDFDIVGGGNFGIWCNAANANNLWLHIANGTIGECSSRSILLEQPASGKSLGLATISGVSCVANSGGLPAIEAQEDTFAVTITGCIVYNCGGAAIDIAGTQFTVTGCLLSSNGAGLRLRTGYGYDVTGNRIRANTSGGIEIYAGVLDFVIVGNNVVGDAIVDNSGAAAGRKIIEHNLT